MEVSMLGNGTTLVSSLFSKVDNTGIILLTNNAEVTEFKTVEEAIEKADISIEFKSLESLYDFSTHLALIEDEFKNNKTEEEK